MKLNTNYTFYSILIFTIVFDLTFTETLVIDSPFSIILTTLKKPSSYSTMSILISTDLQLLTYIHVWNIDKNVFFNYSLYYNLNNVGNTMYSGGNTKIKLLSSSSSLSSPLLNEEKFFAIKDATWICSCEKKAWKNSGFPRFEPWFEP